MAIFRQPIPRRAFLAAALGAVYAVLLIPGASGMSVLFAISWFALSVSLLFARPLAYHAFTFFAILWVAYRCIGWFRAGPGSLLALALDLALPIASLVLLMLSGYLASLSPQEE